MSIKNITWLFLCFWFVLCCCYSCVIMFLDKQVIFYRRFTSLSYFLSKPYSFHLLYGLVSVCVHFFNPFVLAQRWVIYELFLGDVNTKNHVTPARIFFFIYRTFYCRYYTHALHRIQYFLAVNFNKKDFFYVSSRFFCLFNDIFRRRERRELLILQKEISL